MVWRFIGLDDQTAVLRLTVENGGAGRNRTGVNGVAVRCMTTLPPSQVTLKVTVLTKAASLLENELKFTAEYRRILKISMAIGPYLATRVEKRGMRLLQKI